MSKRGQVTLFIVLGVIILVITSLLFMVKLYSDGEKSEMEAEKVQNSNKISVSVQNYIESCLENTGEDAIIFIGNHGGYYNLPLLSDTFFLMPYYLYDGKNNLILKEELGNQISDFINNELFFCLQNFVVFEEQGYDIQQEDVDTLTTIIKDKVIFNVNLPVKLTKGDSVKNIVKFTKEIDSRLYTIYNAIKTLLDEHENNPSSICISCATRLATENDLRVELSFIEEGEIMFTVIDEKVKINNKPFEYSFINRYNFKDE